MITTLSELFEKVVNELELSRTLESGIKYIEQYNGNDWEKYIHQEGIYYRNLVFRTDIVEMYVITWSHNAESCIHDHPERGCIMKLMRGSLEEYVYKNITDESGHNKAILIDKINMTSDDKNMGYKIGKDVLHKIKNINDDISVSLHIYSNPNYSCEKYEDIT